MRRRYAIACLVLLSVAGGCAARKPGDPLRPGFNLYSREQDIEIGRQTSAEVAKQVEIVEDRQLQNYIAELGRRLASQQRADRYPYSFTLVNEKSINAFALPGGPIYINTGLVTAAETEGQLVGVLAHEIGHVALRHATNQASKANLLGAPAALAAAVIGDASAAAQLGQAAVGFGASTILLKYSRDAETESDAFATRLMADAGYNPMEMARFFEKLAEQGGSRAPQFFSSHPNPGNRTEAVQAELRTLPQSRYSAGTGQLENIQDRIQQLPPPRKRLR